jgi:hypothetical protein
MDAEKAAEFVRSYLEPLRRRSPTARSRSTPTGSITSTAGRVNRKFVANDQHSYYRRWPNREFTVVGTPELGLEQGPAGDSPIPHALRRQ